MWIVYITREIFVCALRNVLVKRVVYIWIPEYVCESFSLHLFMWRLFRPHIYYGGQGQNIKVTLAGVLLCTLTITAISPVLHIKQLLYMQMNCWWSYCFFLVWSSCDPRLCVDLHLTCSQRAVIIHSYKRHAPLIQPWRLCGLFLSLLIYLSWQLSKSCWVKQRCP